MPLPYIPEHAGPSELAREPLANRAGIVALVGLIVGALGLLGVHVTDAVSAHLVDLLDAVLLVVSPLVVAWWARKHVTPVTDPQDAAGRPLVAIPDGGVVHVEFPDGIPAVDGDTGPLDLGHGG